MKAFNRRTQNRHFCSETIKEAPQIPLLNADQGTNGAFRRFRWEGVRKCNTGRSSVSIRTVESPGFRFERKNREFRRPLPPLSLQRFSRSNDWRTSTVEPVGSERRSSLAESWTSLHYAFSDWIVSEGRNVVIGRRLHLWEYRQRAELPQGAPSLAALRCRQASDFLSLGRLCFAVLFLFIVFFPAAIFGRGIRIAENPKSHFQVFGPDSVCGGIRDCDTAEKSIAVQNSGDAGYFEPLDIGEYTSAYRMLQACRQLCAKHAKYHSRNSIDEQRPVRSLNGLVSLFELRRGRVWGIPQVTSEPIPPVNFSVGTDSNKVKQAK
jgi:hypothetical protein